MVGIELTSSCAGLSLCFFEGPLLPLFVRDLSIVRSVASLIAESLGCSIARGSVVDANLSEGGATEDHIAGSHK